jgi:hypothetical protein
MTAFVLGMAPIIIKDPTDRDKNDTKEYFLHRKGFPDIIGNRYRLNV